MSRAPREVASPRSPTSVLAAWDGSTPSKRRVVGGDDDAAASVVDHADAPALYASVERRDWPDTVARCVARPEECAVIVVRRDENGGVRWSHTPLHAAILFRAPARVVRALVEAWPEGTRERDDLGATPCHLAFRCGAPESVVNRLLETWPGAANARDREGRTPPELLGRGRDGDAVTMRSCMARHAAEVVSAKERELAHLAGTLRRKDEKQLAARRNDIVARAKEECRAEHEESCREAQRRWEEEKAAHRATREKLSADLAERAKENADLRFQRQDKESAAETLENDNRKLRSTLEEERKEFAKTSSALTTRVEELSSQLREERSARASESASLRQRASELETEMDARERRHRQTAHAHETDAALLRTRVANLASEKDVLLRRAANLAGLLDKVRASNDLRRDTVQSLHDRAAADRDRRARALAGQVLHDKLTARLERAERTIAEARAGADAARREERDAVRRELDGARARVRRAEADLRRVAEERAAADEKRDGERRVLTEERDGALRAAERETRAREEAARTDRRRLLEAERARADALRAAADARAAAAAALAETRRREREIVELKRERRASERDNEARQKDIDLLTTRLRELVDRREREPSHDDDHHAAAHSKTSKDRTIASLKDTKAELLRQVADLREALKWAMEQRRSPPSHGSSSYHYHPCDVSTITEVSYDDDDDDDEDGNDDDKENVAVNQ